MISIDKSRNENKQKMVLNEYSNISSIAKENDCDSVYGVSTKDKEKDKQSKSFLNNNENCTSLYTSKIESQREKDISKSVKKFNNVRYSFSKQTRNKEIKLALDKHYFKINELEIIYHGPLFKYNFSKSYTDHNYSFKYCVLTRNELRFYKSREALLLMPLSPISTYCLTDFDFINKLDFVLKNEEKIFYHLCLHLKKDYINNNITTINNKQSSFEIKNTNNKTMNLLSKYCYKQFKIVNDSILEGEEGNNPLMLQSQIIALGSSKEDLVNKWSIILDYLIN